MSCVCPPQADTYGVGDAGLRRGATYAGWLTTLCSHLGNIQGVLDLLSNGHYRTGVRATLGRPTPRLPSNENRGALSLAIGQPPCSGICAANTGLAINAGFGWK
jgi:hypothetical protein